MVVLRDLYATPADCEFSGRLPAQAGNDAVECIEVGKVDDQLPLVAGAYLDGDLGREDIGQFFLEAHDVTDRNASTTWYRLAIIGGKGLSFPRITGAPADFGTDGGAHNFLRYLEDWGGQTLNYRGAIASMFTSRQAVGTYKCCSDVYTPPTRGYNFDTDFLTPALLPPRTPMFRDVNITGFAQIVRPR